MRLDNKSRITNNNAFLVWCRAAPMAYEQVLSEKNLATLMNIHDSQGRVPNPNDLGVSAYFVPVPSPDHAEFTGLGTQGASSTYATNLRTLVSSGMVRGMYEQRCDCRPGGHTDAVEGCRLGRMLACCGRLCARS